MPEIKYKLLLAPKKKKILRASRVFWSRLGKKKIDEYGVQNHDMYPAEKAHLRKLYFPLETKLFILLFSKMIP